MKKIYLASLQGVTLFYVGFIQLLRQSVQYTCPLGVSPPPCLHHTLGLCSKHSLSLCVSHLVVSDSFRPHGLQPTRLLYPWDSPGKNTGVGCHFLLQQIFPTQGSNPGLPHCRQTLYHLSHQGSQYRQIDVNVWIFIYAHGKNVKENQ